MSDEGRLTEQYFSGVLTRVPFKGALSAALARYMPLESENDFEVFAELPASDAPIFLNFAEHYQILDALVKFANQLWSEDLCILIRLSMPGGMRLPADLLQANVLLMQDVAPEVARLKGQVAHLLVIDDHLLRYQLEQGHNQLKISLYSQGDEGINQRRFAQFIAPLADYGIEPI